jgi:tRNA-2-methylthio-N6-dimethylallyladenosine synthase
VSLARNAGGRTEIAESFRSYDPLREPDMRPGPFQAFVRIMIGCDKFCTYCVVPATRGPEQSRAPSAILREAAVLAGQGVLEITLLGQTVNSYRFVEDGRTWRLADLIAALHDVPGLRRIKFVTNYPKDMTDDLLRAVRELPKCSQYLHVPVQSGSDEVLRIMKRGYTVAEYLEMLDRIRATIPAASVSSDFIVGHPGETEAEFAKSVDLVQRCRFKNSFVFKYSPRPGTKAFDLYADDVPEEEKRRRNNLLLDVQDEISEEDHAEFIGREVEILVEGPSKTARKRAAHAGHGEGADDDEGVARPDEAAHRPGDALAVQLVGRTRCDRIVVFDGNPRLAGSFARIAVEDCTATTLLGRIVVHESRPEAESCDLVALDA